MTYKTLVTEVDEAIAKASSGLALAAPDGSHIVLVSADVRMYAPNRYRVVTVWSTAA